MPLSSLFKAKKTQITPEVILNGFHTTIMHIWAHRDRRLEPLLVPSKGLSKHDTPPPFSRSPRPIFKAVPCREYRGYGAVEPVK